MNKNKLRKGLRTVGRSVFDRFLDFVFSGKMRDRIRARRAERRTRRGDARD